MVEDGTERGHLCHTDTFLVSFKNGTILCVYFARQTYSFIVQNVYDLISVDICMKTEEFQENVCRCP